MKCCSCKNEFDKSELTRARNVKGVYAKSGNYYCIPCEEQEYQRKILVDYIDKWFIFKNYYNNSKTEPNKSARNRLMALVNTQISNLKKDGYTYLQIKLIIEHMIHKENVEFTDTILGLVPYYYMRTSRYHTDLYRIATSETYGYIEPSEYVERNLPPHKPNKKALRITDIESL